ncbi:hypothetical protein HPB50_020334 [Hyalomma asiaticum]|uniref:Uncharacterized protein n=1 Tax=Hyalomma asiaticum TaxID=266040 RepID=A0ACB7TN88_HYAAI|nr:hypothetical protein HPB50_020334 [Hyalomma asiaticum]
MKEANLLRLVQSFVISRGIYVAPYLKFTKAEDKGGDHYEEGDQDGSRSSFEHIDEQNLDFKRVNILDEALKW